MSAIDEGYIKDNRGNTIDFSQAIIIATTNAGQTNEKTTQIGFSSIMFHMKLKLILIFSKTILILNY